MTIVAASMLARIAGRLRSWLSVRHSLPAEAVIVLALYGLYELARGLVVGDPCGAVRHARELAALERRRRDHGCLTHHPRPSIEMEGATTFHFIDASPAEALETAREAADGQDVRIGGGPTMISDFLAAGLVDHMHIVVVPILLGRCERLWDGLEGLEKDYEVEAASSPSGVTHVTFAHARRLGRARR